MLNMADILPTESRGIFGRRRWKKLLTTTLAAFCLALCLRFITHATQLDSYILREEAQGHAEVKVQGQSVTILPTAIYPRKETKKPIFMKIEGDDPEDELHDQNVKPHSEEETQNEKEAQDGKKEFAPVGNLVVVKETKENDEEGDGWNGKCPFENTELEKYKCWLPKEMTEKGGHFDQYLSKKANKDRIIFLISVDGGYVDMALNLYETSFQKLNIPNFLFICSDNEAESALKHHGIECFLFEQEGKNSKASVYMSREFVRKTHIKTKIILGALSLGYTIFITDADIVFLQNPLLHLECLTCDIEIQSDHVEENSGFYVARPTQGAIKLHQSMLYKGLHTNKTSNQKALNSILKSLKKQGSISVGHMHKYRFPCGIYYFENHHRMWANDNPCVDCVMVHNNWITGKSAKVYRFKEHLMWMIDEGGYYSDPTRKYLVYENPINWGNKSRDIEISTLKLALQIGNVTNRTVILPGFTCRGCKGGACKTATNQCALNSHIRISTFDGKFSGLYREHMFLFHPKVPESITNSVSPTVLIGSQDILQKLSDEEKNNKINKIFEPQDFYNGASESEIMMWLGIKSSYNKYSVLKFHSLYKSFQGLDTKSEFMGKIKSAFKKAVYRQY